MNKCIDCGKEFNDKRLLKRHRYRIHNPEYKKPEKKECKVCGKFYSNVDQHFKRKHSDKPEHIEEMERQKEVQRIYYLNHRDIINKRSIEWNNNHRERSNELKRNWAQKNKPLLEPFYKEMIECERCGKSVIRNNLNRHLQGKRCLYRKKFYTPQATKRSEMDKLRDRIKKAEEKNTINRNLVIKENVILEF